MPTKSIPPGDDEKWIPCDGKFTPSDVWRWRQPAWKPKARKSSKAVIIGERRITAQLTKCDGDWLEFELLECRTTNAELWWKRIPELKADKPLRIRRSELIKRRPERRPWGGKDGEAARIITASRFVQ
jgi:hypothetical protein